MTAFELALEVVLQIAIAKKEFTVIGSATTMNFLMCVYNATQIVKSKLAWISIFFLVALTAFGILHLYELYHIIMLEKGQEESKETPKEETHHH